MSSHIIHTGSYSVTWVFKAESTHLHPQCGTSRPQCFGNVIQASLGRCDRRHSSEQVSCPQGAIIFLCLRFGATSAAIPLKEIILIKGQTLEAKNKHTLCQNDHFSHDVDEGDQSQQCHDNEDTDDPWLRGWHFIAIVLKPSHVCLFQTNDGR